MTSAAEAYDHHVGRYGAQLAAGLIGVAGIHAGQRALDVGCGPGQLTSALAALLGPGSVAAIDPSEPFVEACRARVPGADVRVGVGERLPFEPGSFDVVLAQLVVQLMADREAGVREMVRTTRPGGTVAACVWDANAMPLLQAFWDSALEVAPERAGAIEEPRRVGYGRPHDLASVLDRCGLEDVTTAELHASAAYASFDELWQPFADGAGHSGALYGSLGDSERSALRAAALRRLGEPKGPFTLRARAWCARGTTTKE